MKLIIAGSRDIPVTEAYHCIEAALAERSFDITEVVCGKARGVDAAGELWAKDYKIPVKPFPADWSAHGRGAGAVRNQQMAEYADRLLAVSNGSRGTADMVRRMRSLGKPVQQITLE